MSNNKKISKCKNILKDLNYSINLVLKIVKNEVIIPNNDYAICKYICYKCRWHRG